jgi:lipopolysaccharide transport system permease protein
MATTDTVATPIHSGDLLWTFVRTDFKSRYHGTLGGFVWALLKPFAMFIVLLSVFSFVFSTDGQYNLRLIIGLFLFDFFGESTKAGLISLYAKGYLLSKAKFPSWIIVVSSVAHACLTLGVFVAAILLFRTLTIGPPAAAAAGLFLLYVALFVMIVIGFSLATSILFLSYRDLNQVWEVVVQAGFFLAPVVYPLGIIPERYHIFLYAWPPTAVIEFSRAVLVTGMVPSLRAHALLAAEAVAALLIGFAVFRRYAPGAAERL